MLHSSDLSAEGDAIMTKYLSSSSSEVMVPQRGNKQSNIGILDFEDNARRDCVLEQSKSRNWCSELTRKFRRVLFNVRTERAVRFVLPIPILLWLAYDPDRRFTNFAYLGIILYTIMAALTPPMICFAPILWFLAVPGLLYGLGYVTLVWYIEAKSIEHGYSTLITNTFSILTVVAALLLASNFRLGPLSALVIVPYFAAVYMGLYLLVSSESIIRDGLRIHVPADQLDVIAETMLEHKFPTLSKILAQVLKPIIDYILALVLVKDINRVVEIPGSIKNLGFENVNALVGVPVSIHASSKSGLDMSLPGGTYLISFVWQARGKIGVIYGAVVFGLVALGFWVATQCLPPIRSGERLLRQGLCNLFGSYDAALRDWIKSARRIEMLGEDEDSSSAGPLESREVTQLLVYDDQRNRVAMIWESARSLQIATLLHACEALLVSPIGVNTLLAQPKLLIELRNFAAWIYMTNSFLSGLDQSFGRATVSPKDSSTGQLYRWVIATLEASDKLLQALQSGVALRMELPSDSAAQHLRQTVLSQIGAATDHLRLLDRESAPILQKTLLDKWTAARDLERIQSRTDEHTMALELWILFFRTTAIQKPLQLAEAVQNRIELNHKKSWKSFGISIGGFCVGLPIFFYSLIEPWVRVLKHFINKCKSRRKTNDPQPFSNWHELTKWAYNSAESGPRPPDSGSTTSAEKMEAARRTITSYSEQTNSSLLIACGPYEVTRFRRLPNGNTEITLNSKKTINEHKFWQHDAMWYAFRLTIGASLLYSFALINGWRTLDLTDRTNSSDSIISMLPVETTKYAPWACLGFLTTMMESWNATFKKAVLRIIGVVIGSMFAYAMLSLNAENGYIHAIWLVCFNFLSVWFTANPANPSAGFHPSWGYVGQVFTYQQTIIIVESHLGLASKNEIVVARLLGHCVGIGMALLLASILFPTRANYAIRLRAADGLACLQEALEADFEIGFINYLNSTEGAEEKSKFAGMWSDYERGKVARAQQHLNRARELIKENLVFAELPPKRLWQTNPTLCNVVDSIELLMHYRVCAREYLGTYLKKEKDLSERANPELFADASSLSTTIRALAEEVMIHVKSTSVLIQETIANSRHPYCCWRRPAFNPDPVSFELAMRHTTEAAMSRLDEITILLPRLREIMIAGKLATARNRTGTIEEVVDELGDLRTAMWAFAVLEIRELQRLGEFVHSLISSV